MLERREGHTRKKAVSKKVSSKIQGSLEIKKSGPCSEMILAEGEKRELQHCHEKRGSSKCRGGRLAVDEKSCKRTQQHNERQGKDFEPGLRQKEPPRPTQPRRERLITFT